MRGIPSLNRLRLRLVTAPTSTLSGAAVRFLVQNLLGRDYLQTVKLSSCGLVSFPEVLASQNNASLHEIRTVDLTDNDVSTIPADIQHMLAVENLLLSGNRLTALPREIGQLRGLVQLQLAGNYIQALPEELCTLVNLEVLNVEDNQLCMLPSNIGSLSKLHLLDVSCNHLCSLPHSFTRLAALADLNISHNRLETLPEDMGLLTNLVRLQASFNNLTHLPESIGHCFQLEVIQVASNKLTHVPHEIGSLPHLCWFTLRNNPASPTPPCTSRDQWTLPWSNITMGRNVSGSAPGKVQAAVFNNQAVAVKLIFESEENDDESAYETMVAACINHPNIATPIGCTLNPSGLVFTWIKGDTLATKSTCVPEKVQPPAGSFMRDVAVEIALDIAQALSYLHSKHICHGDVAAYNVIVGESNKAVLIDLSAAFFYHPEESMIWQPMEVSAYGTILEELANRTPLEEEDLRQLSSECLHSSAAARPEFSTIVARLTKMRMGKVMTNRVAVFPNRGAQNDGMGLDASVRGASIDSMTRFSLQASLGKVKSVAPMRRVVSATNFTEAEGSKECDFVKSQVISPCRENTEEVTIRKVASAEDAMILFSAPLR